MEEIGNWGIVEEINAQRRQESEHIVNEVDLRVSRITPEQLRDEISPIFAKIERSTGVNRSRVSKSIRDEAYQILRKKIRLMVSHEFDLQFLRDNAETEQLRETLAGKINTPDIIDAKTSARLVFDNQI